jgi:hypothetical protein
LGREVLGKGEGPFAGTEAEGAQVRHTDPIQTSEPITLHDGETPQFWRKDHYVPVPVEEVIAVAVAQIESEEAGAQRHHFSCGSLVNVDRVEPNDLKGMEWLGVLVEEAGDVDSEEREAREERARRWQVEVELVRDSALPRLDVEVLDTALGGVVEEAPQLGGPELADVHGEREAVEATARPRLPLQRVELPPQGVAGREVDLDGGAVRPPALPQVTPAAGQHPRADGLFEREVGEEALPEFVRQHRNPVHLFQHSVASTLLLIHPPPLRSAAGVERHFPLVPRLRLIGRQINGAATVRLGLGF